jgi:hypothetical protein
MRRERSGGRREVGEEVEYALVRLVADAPEWGPE